MNHTTPINEKADAGQNSANSDIPALLSTFTDEAIVSAVKAAYADRSGQSAGGGSDKIKKMNSKDQRLTEIQNEIAAVLLKYPCPQCRTVRLLWDAKIPAASCACGEAEGCAERWETGDIWSQMTPEEQAETTANEAILVRWEDRLCCTQTHD